MYILEYLANSSLVVLTPGGPDSYSLTVLDQLWLARLGHDALFGEISADIRTER